MLIGHWLAVVAMFLFPASEEKQNPWKQKVAPAVAEAERAGSAEAYHAALDVAWRADDWQVGLRLAREALVKHRSVPQLYGPVARALWRAGYLTEAERVTALLPARVNDRVALAMRITTHLARGEKTQAAAAVERLESSESLSGEDLYHVITARLALNRLDGLSKLIRRAEKLTDPDHGYPETFIAEHLAGLAEFLDAVGSEPLNQLASSGAAPLPVIPLINLPGCQVMINGQGPYRLILDTGGSITLSLDDEVAAELGLRSLADANVHGVSGKTECGQAIVDELKIGEIRCRRVMTRIFPVRRAVAYAADGILGTGMFADGRMTLDFQHGRLVLAPSSERPGPGAPTDLRIVGDAKLVAPLSLQGEPAAALLDTGADAFAVAPSRLARLFPGKNIRSMSVPMLGVGDGHKPTLSLTPGVDFVFAGRKYTNYGGLGLDVLDTLLGPLLGVQTDLLVGMPVMREMKTLTIDFPRCKMWVDWLDAD